MASVSFKNLSKQYTNNERVIRDINFDIEDGEFVVFVGPSGCGKSTLLRMVAGLEEVTDGEIYIDQALANDVPASKRGVAMVFQSYALYPHMTVRDNMGFALKMAGSPKSEIHNRVNKAAEILQIMHLLDRKPKALSGGQRQRVAIGRAIVRQPKVFLFDEPLSNLDAALRQNMRIELSKLHHELGTTMIYVTHDQVEAMTLADRIVVFDGGQVQQIGAPLNLYENPSNLFVASFLGAPKINLLQGKVGNPEVAQIILSNGQTVFANGDTSKCASGDELTLGIRPEHVQLISDDAPGSLSGTVVLVEHLGDQVLVYFHVDGVMNDLCVKLPSHGSSLKYDDKIRFRFPEQHCLLFAANGMTLPRTIVK